MSLRDQLLAKGLVSKKSAAKADRSAKRNRKQKQGSKQRKAELERAAAAKSKAIAEAETLKREADLRARRAKKDAYSRALQIRNLLIGHRIENRGDHRFFFIKRDGRTIGSMRLHPRVADELSKGALGIGWLDEGIRDTYVLLGSKGVRRLQEIGAVDVLMHAIEPSKRGPDEHLLQRDWEPSMRPHRVRST